MVRTLRRTLLLWCTAVLAVVCVGAGALSTTARAGAATTAAATQATTTPAGSTPATTAQATSTAATTPDVPTAATTAATSATPATSAVPTSPGAAPTAAPSSTGAVTYGMADAQGSYARCTDAVPYCCAPDTASCDLGSLDGFFKDSLFQQLTAPASAHRVSEVRLFVSYDALMEWNGSTTAPGCVYSRALEQPWVDAAGRPHEAGESWRDLLAGLIEARAQGLTPIVSISGYASPHAMPSWDQPAPDPTTVGGLWEYRCGLQGILSAVAKLPAWEQPHIWEAFNEPDGYLVFRSLDGIQASSCAVGATPQANGAAKAACLYAEGAREIHQFADHAQDTVIADTQIHPSVPWLDTYVAALARQLPSAEFPAVWSVHDYTDVTAASLGPAPTLLAGYDQALAAASGGRARELWVTEAGVLLTDHQRGGACPAIGPDAAGSLGACVNGQPLRQATSAAAFFQLPSVATAVPITHLFWYEFESEPNWDSGLVDAGDHPRAGWCTFYGSGTCNGSPDAS